MSYMALEVAPFCTRVLAPFYLRVSTLEQERKELVSLLKESAEKSVRKYEQRRKRRFVNSKPPELHRSIRYDYSALVDSYHENKIIWM